MTSKIKETVFAMINFNSGNTSKYAAVPNYNDQENQDIDELLLLIKNNEKILNQIRNLFEETLQVIDNLKKIPVRTNT
jgi:hypothetical protein